MHCGDQREGEGLGGGRLVSGVASSYSRVEDVNLAWRAWLMSLVHADFSCLEEATRMTVNDWLSFGSTTILKSRCSMSWPLLSDLAGSRRDAHKGKQMSSYWTSLEKCSTCWCEIVRKAPIMSMSCQMLQIYVVSFVNILFSSQKSSFLSIDADKCFDKWLLIHFFSICFFFFADHFEWCDLRRMLLFSASQYKVFQVKMQHSHSSSVPSGSSISVQSISETTPFCQQKTTWLVNGKWPCSTQTRLHRKTVCGNKQRICFVLQDIIVWLLTLRLDWPHIHCSHTVIKFSQCLLSTRKHTHVQHEHLGGKDKKNK